MSGVVVTSKLYGVPLSQPFRSVAWLLLQKRVPFQVQIVVPGATSKIGSRTDSFRSKTVGRTGYVPVYEEELEESEDRKDGSSSASFALAESPAILSYLCESRTWTDWYPASGSKEKALIDTYMHWHHQGTRRRLVPMARPLLRPDLNEAISDEDQDAARAALSRLDTAWLGSREKQTKKNFLVGSSTPTIADLLAYEEVLQATCLGGIDEELSMYPNLRGWMERMEQLPFHKEAHAAVYALGNLKTPDEEEGVPLAKRLGNATKAGLQALQEAQAQYGISSST